MYDDDVCFGCDGRGVIYAPGYGSMICTQCGGSGEICEDHQYDDLLNGFTVGTHENANLFEVS